MILLNIYSNKFLIKIMPVFYMKVSRFSNFNQLIFFSILKSRIILSVSLSKSNQHVKWKIYLTFSRKINFRYKLKTMNILTKNKIYSLNKLPLFSIEYQYSKGLYFNRKYIGGDNTHSPGLGFVIPHTLDWPFRLI